MSIIQQYIDSRDRLFKEDNIQYESKFIQTAGLTKKVHYLELGVGRPIILIHGGGSHASEWFTVLRALAGSYRLYVVDRPGCGLTDAMDYRQVDFKLSVVDFISSFMDALGLKKASFICQSMGGFFGINFALQHPQCVEQLILIGAPAGMNYYIPPMLRVLGIRGLNRVLANTVGRPSLRNVKDIHRQLLMTDISRLPENYYLHALHSQMLPDAQRSFLSLLEKVTTIRGWRRSLYIGDQLGGLKVPTGFIWGNNDVFEGPSTGRAKSQSIENCQFEIVNDAGHCPWLDQSERCTELIQTMLKNDS